MSNPNGYNTLKCSSVGDRFLIDAAPTVQRVLKAVEGNPGLYRLARVAQLFLSKILILHRSRAINAYLSSPGAKRLQIGAGFSIKLGWLNADLLPWSLAYLRNDAIVMDAARRLPFPDASFDYVFSEHLIEHLSYPDGLSMLTECYRIMRPGGRIRIATPNLENWIGLYLNVDSDIKRKYIEYQVANFLQDAGRCEPIFVLNLVVRAWGHQFIYDRRTLRCALESAGFTRVENYGPGESDDETLRGAERHGELIGEDMNRFETMVLEAVRPT